MRSSLGKGLSQLIGEQTDGTPSQVAITAIVPNSRQPREHFDEAPLQELAESIRTFGVLQPLVVRPLTEGRFELIAGERRLRASKLAGLEYVPVVVRAADNQASLEIALIENVQREDISPLECARAYTKLMQEFGLTQDQVAAKVGKARTSIANTIRLLKLPQRVLTGLEMGKLTEGHARALLSLDSEILQIALFDQIVEKGLSVRDVEKAARPNSSRRSNPRTSTATVDLAWQSVQDSLAHYFGTPVQLTGTEKGGKIIIDFYSEEDLSRIVEVLGVSV